MYDLLRISRISLLTRSILVGMLLFFVTTSLYASQTGNIDALQQNVSRFAELYRAKGRDATVEQMKSVRRQTGSAVIFSIVEVDGATPGKILYHPTPFVTGNFIQMAENADGKQPGAELLDKARASKSGEPFWLEYTVKSSQKGRLLRQMCCYRVGQHAVCGSMPTATRSTPQ